MDRFVCLPVPAAVELVPVGLSAGGGNGGDTPHSEANFASHGMRLGFSPAAIASAAALTVPHPFTCRRAGALASMSRRMALSSWPAVSLSPSQVLASAFRDERSGSTTGRAPPRPGRAGRGGAQADPDAPRRGAVGARGIGRA